VIAISDAQAKKLKAQDPNAFNEFYLETVDVFFRYINANYFVPKQDAEDIISDFYVKFREAVKSYNPEFSFTGYFWTIFRNIIKDHFKKTSELSFTDMRQDEEDQDF
jgi:RNA polymerase sigma factor (sigma-70 family)